MGISELINTQSIHSAQNFSSINEIFAVIRATLEQVEAKLKSAAAGQHPALDAATQYVLSAGGKRVRPGLTLLAGGVFGSPIAETVTFASAVELLHTATLVHDDLVDGALFRRGVPTLNANWTPAATILTGDYLFARSASWAASTQDVRVMTQFAESLMIVVSGELRQQFTSKASISRDDYAKRIFAKTASLFCLACEGAAVLGKAPEAQIQAITEYGRLVGMAFQVMDDILDFVGQADHIGKPVGGDLQQGLFTLPAIFFCEANPSDADVAALRGADAGNRRIVERVVEKVRSSGAIQAAHREAREYVQKARELLNQLPQNDYTQRLHALAEFTVARDL
ncbi:MAG TPA: polyprenyl synthetase family protein [Anaerolineales bacterium]|nr:polyprenyl synthetase family protein [Anaerolineales bacterium]